MESVSTQAELDSRLADCHEEIKCIGPGPFKVRIPNQMPPAVTIYVSVRGVLDAEGPVTIRAEGRSTIWAGYSVTVYAMGGALIIACRNSTIYARGHSVVRASDAAVSHISEYAVMYARDRSSTYASGSTTVHAEAYALVHARGTRPTIYVHSPSVKAFGGTQICRPATISSWAAQYGVECSDGVVILYKAVDNDYHSGYRFPYVPGSIPVAPDWDYGCEECGGGLHFCASPRDAQTFFSTATRFIACPVAIKDIAVTQWGSYPEKIKARGCCAPVWEVDIDGNHI